MNPGKGGKFRPKEHPQYYGKKMRLENAAFAAAFSRVQRWSAELSQ